MSLINISQNSDDQRKILRKIAEEKELRIQNATQRYKENIANIWEISLVDGISEGFLRREIEHRYDAEIASIHRFYVEKIEKLLQK